MSLLEKLRSLVEEPPPAFAFEVGPSGISHWQSGQVRFDALSGIEHETDAVVLGEALAGITQPPNGNRRRAAALILPDRSARVSLMDFDQFPRKAEDQQALIRFRLKRTVPFDIDTAILRYQVRPKGANRVDLTVAAIAVETIAPYETAFRMAGFHPGFVTIGGLSAASLAAPGSITLRLSGLTLTLSQYSQTGLGLYRCLELQAGTLDEILNVVDPTLAYLEDERKTRPTRIDICGLGAMASDFSMHLRETWKLETQPLRSRLGAVDAYNAGLYGYLDSMGVS